MRKLFILVLLPMGLCGQNWKYDFGTGTGSHTSGISTSFLPSAPSGTSRVRVGTGGGSFILNNPGLTALGSNSELEIIASSSGSNNKFSIFGYASATAFTTKFTIKFGDSTGGDTATSGDFYFIQGSGASYSNNTNLVDIETFAGLRFRFGASGTIETRRRNSTSTSWVTTNIVGTPVSQTGVYQVELIGNNSAASIAYSRGTVAANTYDVYVNGTIVGDDVPKGGLANTTNIDAWMFYGDQSIPNSATIFIDDIEYSNYICGNLSMNSSTETNLSEQCVDGSWTSYGTTTNRFFAINKNGNTFTPTVNITVSSTAVDSSKSSNGANQEHASYLMKRFWNVDCGGCTPTIGGGVSVRFFYNQADSTAARNAMRAGYTALKATNVNTLADTTTSMQWVKNTTGVPYEPTMFTGNKLTVAHLKLSPTYGSLNGVRYVEFSGIQSFSGGGGGFGFGPPPSGGGGVGLPVTWAGFDASVQRDYTELIWHTASEQNTSHFEVEASEDGKTFKKISENIAAAGNSASLLTYSFRDMDMAPVKYYRLKQVDLEGGFEYSKIIVAKRSEGEKQDFDLVVYPVSENNNKEYHLLLKNKVEDISAIQIVDYTGKPVFHMTSSKNAELLDLNYLTPGIYMIQVCNGEEKQVERVVVQ